MKVAIIGGSGVKDSPTFKDALWSEIDTAYRTTNHSGVINYQSSKDGVIFIPRHGKWPEIYGPSAINYAANLIAAKKLGAEAIVATSAVGSLQRLIRVESLVILEDYIDETGRNQNLYGVGFVVHVVRNPPFSPALREILCQVGQQFKERFKGVHEKATCVVIPGDAFGTPAEGKRRSQYADIVGMTICPEAVMAQQLGLHYAVAAFPVDADFDANHEGATLEVMNRMSEAHRVPAFIDEVVKRVLAVDLGPVPGLKGNIINGNFRHIANPTLRATAEELVERYCS